MAAFNLRAMMGAVKTMIEGLPSITSTDGTVYFGEPESFASRINVFLAIGAATPHPKTTQQASREPQVIAWFAYRVATREETAELVLCDFIDELTSAVYVDRSLGGTSTSAEVSTDAASLPQYQFKSGEYRYYPVTITGSQQKSTP